MRLSLVICKQWKATAANMASNQRKPRENLRQLNTVLAGGYSKTSTEAPNFLVGTPEIRS